MPTSCVFFFSFSAALRLHHLLLLLFFFLSAASCALALGHPHPTLKKWEITGFSSRSAKYVFQPTTTTTQPDVADAADADADAAAPEVADAVVESLVKAVTAAWDRSEASRASAWTAAWAKSPAEAQGADTIISAERSQVAALSRRVTVVRYDIITPTRNAGTARAGRRAAAVVVPPEDRHLLVRTLLTHCLRDEPRLADYEGVVAERSATEVKFTYRISVRSVPVASWGVV